MGVPMQKNECSGCGETFASLGAHKKHRVGGYGGPIYLVVDGKQTAKVIGRSPSTRRCLTVEEITAKGWTRNEKGWWLTNDFDARAKAAFSKVIDEEAEPEEELEESA